MAKRDIVAEQEQIAADIQLLLQYLEVTARNYRGEAADKNLFNMIGESCTAIRNHDYKNALPAIDALIKRGCRSVLIYKMAGRHYEKEISEATRKLGLLAYWRWCLLSRAQQ